MTKGFVFGKFLPFHKGHESMIRFALGKCDFLSVLICCSDRESIPGEIRKSWIEKTFGNNGALEVRVFDYLESALPNTSVSSRSVSERWATAFKELFPGYAILVTSEAYGNFVASYMGIRHIPYDISRALFPVSATAIRSDLFSNWQFLPNSVKPYYAIKVVLSGTESTGKTSLTEKLAGRFQGAPVFEAGRDIIANSNSFGFDDLHLVAREHARRIDRAVISHSPLIVIDTDIHTTISYGKFIFGRELAVPYDIFASNKADLYLYLTADAPYFQDGTRLSEAERNLLDISHRQTLAAHGIGFVEITGNWEERFAKSVEQLGKIL